MELINLHKNMSAPVNNSAISSVTPLITLSTTLSTSVVFILLALAAFNQYKNPILKTPDLTTGSHGITKSFFSIWINDQSFIS